MAAGSRIRLVKGGYWEPAEVVYRTKAEVDAAFLRDIERLVRQGSQPAIATHDETAVAVVRRVAEEAGIGREGFEFQMLYGVRPDLQAALIRDGYAVRCYVPYGGQWYAYVLGCLRRLPGGAVRRMRTRLTRWRR
jgi:proline dehydrogenase